MKTHEWMIGDWVYVPHNGNATHYGRITAILPSGTIEVDLNGNTVLCSSGSVEPIPLTTEILEKNGFLFDGLQEFRIAEWGKDGKKEYSVAVCPIQPSNERWNKDCTGFSVETSTSSISYIGKTNVYVHELQHTLRLCGIEKEIIL